MDDGYEFERFRQRMLVSPQRRKLGIDMDQATALRILSDEAALRREYLAWRHLSAETGSELRYGGETGSS